MSRRASFGGTPAEQWPLGPRSLDDSAKTEAPSPAELQERQLQGDLRLGGRTAAEANQALAELRKHFPSLTLSKHMVLQRRYHRQSSLGQFYEDGFQIEFRNLPVDSPNVWILMRGLLAVGVLRMIREASTARGQLGLRNPQLHSVQSTKWGPVRDLSIFSLLERLEAALNSDESVNLEESEFILRYLTPRLGSHLKRLGKRKGPSL